MISEEIRAREETCRTVVRWMTAGYAAFGMALMIIHAYRKDWYLAVHSAGTLAALAAFFGAMRLMRIRPVYSLYVMIVPFMFGSYTLGVACALYKTVPGYDKLMHMLSGTLTMMLALPLFYALKAGHRVERRDCLLAAVFCAAVSMAVAGIWELAEYALSLVTDLDPQCALETGVKDTMKDMIVCAAGALAGLPSLVRFYKNGHGGLLYSPAEAFAALNFPENEGEKEGYQGEKGEAGV